MFFKEVAMQLTNRATDVALYLLWLAQEAGDSTLTNLKLLKLIYYVQGFTLAADNRQLFVEAIEAWEHGPVVASVYNTYKSYVNRPINIEITEEPKLLDEVDRETIRLIYETYGTRDAVTLRSWTHLETPWMNASVTGASMSLDLIRSFFSSVRMPSSRETEEQIIMRLSVQYVKGIVGIAEIAKVLGNEWTIMKVVDMLEKRGMSRMSNHIGLSSFKRKIALARIEKLRSTAASLNNDADRIEQEAQASVRLDI